MTLFNSQYFFSLLFRIPEYTLYTQSSRAIGRKSLTWGISELDLGSSMILLSFQSFGVMLFLKMLFSISRSVILAFLLRFLIISEGIPDGPGALKPALKASSSSVPVNSVFQSICCSVSFSLL